ncbi:helix-turn-helix domain-containing protein (plasmid) [Bacillus toyonensis]|uniref:helix-turn-helix domain-containing protein n=1 Tax=Bacillus cereus group TaxID=86661 RepID=UPI001E50DFE3|nr:helix-turn-helix domain-containing protein [Bacillus toyonensis]
MEKRNVHIFSLNYEWERELLKEKQRVRLDIVKKGGQLGRPRKCGKKHEGMEHAIHLYKEGKRTINQICNITK